VKLPIFKVLENPGLFIIIDNMKLSQFDYHLPKELIAQRPARPRDSSRLMVLDRKKKTISHDFFYNLGKYLKSTDVLVLNNSKVIKVKLKGQKETGGKTEVLCLEKINDRCFKVLAKKVKVGDRIYFPNLKKPKLIGEIIKKENELRILKFNTKKNLLKIIEKLGSTPLPPYIKTKEKEEKLGRWYQTVYAKVKGSIAAPTAGFHFTKRLIKKLKKKGIKFEFITLHVGLGTFQPIKTEDIEKHRIYPEYAEIKPAVAKRLNLAKKEGRRIIAVGTTTTRALEGFFEKNELKAGKKKVDLFIYPGYQFKFIDGLITNFHLPRSSLLLLVSAFAGYDFIFKAYQEAISKKYRFYSFGDAMLIL
jgi:S-adenosylmethionine:tRNA ribosyltransferase-isomerase